MLLRSDTALTLVLKKALTPIDVKFDSAKLLIVKFWHSANALSPIVVILLQSISRVVSYRQLRKLSLPMLVTSLNPVIDYNEVQP
jgi:hypothetical protein